MNCAYALRVIGAIQFMKPQASIHVAQAAIHDGAAVNSSKKNCCNCSSSFYLLLIIPRLHQRAHTRGVIQLALADAQGLRRDLQELVVREEFEALL